MLFLGYEQPSLILAWQVRPGALVETSQIVAVAV